MTGLRAAAARHQCGCRRPTITQLDVNLRQSLPPQLLQQQPRFHEENRRLEITITVVFISFM